MVGGIFLVGGAERTFYKWAGISEGGWRHILGEWGWVKIFYVYVGVSGGIIWVV